MIRAVVPLAVARQWGEVVVTEERGRQAMVRDDNGFVSYLTETGGPAAEGGAETALLTFLSVADLDQTVAFYNNVFGMGIEAPAEAAPTPERITALTGNPALATFRLAQGTFPGTDVTVYFQEFTGAEKTPVHHRVQDPGGPIFTMGVEDFAGTMELVKANGGMIGDGETSAMLEPDATVSWIRDPNGLLIRVSQAQPAAGN